MKRVREASDKEACPQAGFKKKRRQLSFDWLLHPHDNLTHFQQWVINLDWSRSPLGQIKSWPLQLRQMVLMVMSDPTPAVIYWGTTPIMVYNEAYTKIIGDKHPAMQGQDPRTGFPDLWPYFDELLTNQRANGKTVLETKSEMMIHRRGFLEEVFFDWKFTPIIGSDGEIVGAHATVADKTREVFSDRQLDTVLALSQQLSECRTVEDLCQCFILLVFLIDQHISACLAILGFRC